jgi:hypothetical protein
MNSGKTADEIEAAHHMVTSQSEPRDEKGEAEARGWNMQVDSDLALLRQAEREYSERVHEPTPIERTKQDQPYVQQMTALADKEAPDDSWLPSAAELAETRGEYQETQYQEAEAG